MADIQYQSVRANVGWVKGRGWGLASETRVGTVLTESNFHGSGRLYN